MGVQWLLGSERVYKITGKSGITQARQRLGWEAMRALYDEVVQPIAQKQTAGAWYKEWRVVSLDGSTLDIADSEENEQVFGRPGTGEGHSGYPQLRFVALLENGTHVMFASRWGRCNCSEQKLAEEVMAGGAAGGNAVLGGPLVYWRSAMAKGGENRSGTAVAL